MCTVSENVTFSAYSLKAGAIGITTHCLGDNQNGLEHTHHSFIQAHKASMVFPEARYKVAAGLQIRVRT